MRSATPAIHSPRRAAAAAASLALAAGALAGCAGNGDDPREGGALDQVTYLTSFGQLGRDAYVYVAQEQGYFEDAGIQVTVGPGTGMGQKTQALAGGQAHFAALDMSAAIIAVDEGVSDFAMYAAIHQQAPAALMATDPEIRTPADLEGGTVAVAAGAVTELLLPTYFASAGADLEAVQVNSVSPADLIGALASGNADAVEQFAMGEPTMENAVGSEVRVLPYSEYLTDLYGVGLATTTDIAEHDPDLAERFRDALLRGLRHSLDNPQQAGETLAAHVPEADPTLAARELEIMRSYSEPTDGPLGTLDPDRLAQGITLLQQAGAINADPTLAPEDLVDLDLLPSDQDAA